MIDDARRSGDLGGDELVGIPNIIGVTDVREYQRRRMNIARMEGIRPDMRAG